MKNVNSADFSAIRLKSVRTKAEVSSVDCLLDRKERRAGYTLHIS